MKEKTGIGKERIRFLMGLLGLTYNLLRYETLVRYGKVGQELRGYGQKMRGAFER